MAIVTAAIVTDGLITNLIQIESTEIPSYPDAIAIPSGISPQIGWFYSSNTFTAPPIPTVTKDQLSIYVNKTQANVLSNAITINVAASGQPALNVLCDGTNSTLSTFSLLVPWSQQFPTATRGWVQNNGVTVQITGAECAAMMTAVGNWIDNTYTTLATSLAAIRAGTMTTYAEIDAIAWPTS